MYKLIKTLLPTISVFMAVVSFGQDSLYLNNNYPEGISIEYGNGNYSVRDEFISKEKYVGNLPYLSLGWAREHAKYVYRLDMTIRGSNKIYNYNASTELTQFTLNQGFLYPLKKKSLFKKDLYILIGPSTELFFYSSSPDVAFATFNFTHSVAALFSLGLNTDLVYPLSHKFQLETSVRLTILSLGLRMIDFLGDDSRSPDKALTLFSGFNSSFTPAIRFHIVDQLSVKLCYKFELANIREWDRLISTSNSVIFGVTYKF